MPAVQLLVVQRRRVIAAGPEAGVPGARRGAFDLHVPARSMEQAKRRAGSADLGRVVAVQLSPLGELSHGDRGPARPERHPAIVSAQRLAARHAALGDTSLDIG